MSRPKEHSWKPFEHTLDLAVVGCLLVVLRATGGFSRWYEVMLVHVCTFSWKAQLEVITFELPFKQSCAVVKQRTNSIFDSLIVSIKTAFNRKIEIFKRLPKQFIYIFMLSPVQIVVLKETSYLCCAELVLHQLSFISSWRAFCCIILKQESFIPM